MPSFDDYIVYVDESGDHSLSDTDPQFPVFTLAFCLFEKQRYARECAPTLIELKFAHLGHDQHVLHEHELRKQTPPFDFLRDAARRDPFFRDLNALIEAAPMTLIASVIRKDRYQEAYAVHDNPYHLALDFGLERLHKHLHHGLGCRGGSLHVVFEKRGRKEDTALRVAFEEACARGSFSAHPYPFRCFLSDKRSNSTGLQIADLVARPISLHVIRPDQPNRAWDILQPKLRRSPSGKVEGWGLKVFP